MRRTPTSPGRKSRPCPPDVLTLDVEMPKVDGLTLLEKLMRGHPMPVVMVSSLTEVGCQTTLRALELGAVDFITKPKIDLREGTDEVAQDLIDKVKAAAIANVKRRAPDRKRKDAPLSSHVSPLPGDAEALKEVLEVLPPNTPPVLITQHMPEHFKKTFADRLNSLCKISVKEVEDGDSVLPGHALIAPGNYHMTLVRSGARYSVRLSQDPPVNRHRPSVDVMFHSVAQYAGTNSVGVILTGMGGDGARCLLEMKQSGAFTIGRMRPHVWCSACPKKRSNSVLWTRDCPCRTFRPPCWPM